LSNPGDIRSAWPRRAIRSPGLFEVPPCYEMLIGTWSRHRPAAQDAASVGWAGVRMARRFTGV